MIHNRVRMSCNWAAGLFPVQQGLGEEGGISLHSVELEMLIGPRIKNNFPFSKYFQTINSIVMLCRLRKGLKHIFYKPYLHSMPLGLFWFL